MDDKTKQGAVATGRTADHSAWWAARPLDPTLSQETAVQVVGKRCVYVHDYRVAGGKPYYSENLPNQRFETTIRDVLAAFSDEVLRKALAEREALAAHNQRWRDAAAILAQKGQPNDR